MAGNFLTQSISEINQPNPFNVWHLTTKPIDFILTNFKNARESRVERNHRGVGRGPGTEQLLLQHLVLHRLERSSTGGCQALPALRELCTQVFKLDLALVRSPPHTSFLDFGGEIGIYL